MKKAILVVLIAGGMFVGNGEVKAVDISNFGSSVAGDMTGSWSSGYTAATSTVVGNVGAGNGLQDFDTPFGSILGQTSFRLTAAVSVNPGTSFSITVFDQEGDTAVGTFNWSSFGSSLSSVETPISFDSNFNSLPLGWELATGGVGQSITVQFNALAAIPEPSVGSLFALALLGVCFRRRR